MITTNLGMLGFGFLMFFMGILTAYVFAQQRKKERLILDLERRIKELEAKKI